MAESSALVAVSGSFRDPRGHVFTRDGRIFRSVRVPAADDYRFVQESGLLKSLIAKGWLVDTWDVDVDEAGLPDDSLARVVEHCPLPFVSHPYEWSFGQLRAAALHHLDVHLHALDHGATLSDASAYNIQFDGATPVFIDVLSLRRYRPGEFWFGHRQFCEQFLNPLLLRAWFGIPHNAWYRGNLDGIPSEQMAALVPLSKRMSLLALSHVILPARMQQRSGSHDLGRLARLRERNLPLRSFRSMLLQLHSWISGMKAGNTATSVWGDYEHTHTYDTVEQVAKRRFVAEFVAANKPRLIWDLGCNTGDYSELALQSGAEYVVGFDSDKDVLEYAYMRAQERRLAFLPLFLDAANPSPDQGWRNLERDGLMRRARADAVLALAFEHHLTIGRNVPLDQTVRWLTDLAPCGVIEWVEKTDRTVKRMLALREDIFDQYRVHVFEQALAPNARIVKSETISAEGRRLYWYERRS